MKPNTSPHPDPTDRELALLKVLWTLKEASVRQIYEALREDLPIVQNTVQAFLRTMTEKGLVTYRTEGRSFVYRATIEPEATRRGLLERVLDRAYDGALDQLVAGALSIKPPSRDELAKLESLLTRMKAEQESGEGPR